MPTWWIVIIVISLILVISLIAFIVWKKVIKKVDNIQFVEESTANTNISANLSTNFNLNKSELDNNNYNNNIDNNDIELTTTVKQNT